MGQLCFTVTIEDDMLLEFDEAFAIQLDGAEFSPVGVVAGSPDTTVITIRDDQGEQSRDSRTSTWRTIFSELPISNLHKYSMLIMNADLRYEQK